MNRPIIALLIAAALTAGTVASCGTKDGAGSSAEMPEEISLTPEESDDRAGDSIVSDDSAGEITGELSSDQIGVEGHVFTLPCAFSEWTDNGWEFADPAGTLESNHYVHVQRFKKGDKVVFVKIYNPTSETIPYADGVITSVKVDFMYGIDSVMLPQGLLFDKNTEEEDVLAAYGTPYFRSETEDTFRLYYQDQKNPYHNMDFYVMKPESRDTGVYPCVEIENFS